MRVIELFKTITKIPRCSGTHQPFIEYLQQFAQENNYICKVDSANNILCYKEDFEPTLCLQSHYDIVCLEDGTIPDIVEEDGYLKAKNSTLGADNGIGCAYMLALMEEGKNCEFLFTCDEEIGLIGANDIDLELSSKYMLNLDSEAEGEICIGCAGGIDIFATTKKSEYLQNTQNKTLYEITIDDLDGGHSGVDIDKNIPNAIKLLAKTIKEANADLLDIDGGQRINAIPKSAKAIVASSTTPIASSSNMKIVKVDTHTEHYKKLDEGIVDFLYIFANGVRGYDKEIDVVQSSINLAIVENSIDGVKISLSARSMENELLDILKDETIYLLKLFGFDVTTMGKYPAWKPIRSEFTTKVHNIYKKHLPSTTINAIHAGLECAIFKDKYPSMQICSIGPNIYFPHSFREKCEISSTIKLYDVVKDIVESIKD